MKADEPVRPFYGEYAWAYDLIVGPPGAARLDFIAGLFAECGAGAGARVLDAGCGAGAYTLGLARRGYDVTGLDASEQLLNEARRRAAEAGLAAKFISGDILALPAPPAPPALPRYDALLCRGVLNDLLDARGRRRAFTSFAGALKEGGVLVLDVREWRGTLRRKRAEPVFERSVETPRGRLNFRSVTRPEPRRRRLVVEERHALLAGGAERVSEYTFTMRCWTEEELRDCLSRAGFVGARYFGAYDAAVPAGSTDRLVCVASRS